MTFTVSVSSGAQIQYRWNFGDGTPLTAPATGSGTFTQDHSYAPDDTYFVNLIIVDPPGCTATPDPIDVDVDPCPGQQPPPPPPTTCPVEQVTVIVEDSSGVPVTDQLADGGCVPPGRYVVRAEIRPAGSTNVFIWSVDGSSAVVGQRGVVAINGRRLTIDLSTSRTVSVIAGSCQSGSIELRPCDPLCCPDLGAVTASCMPRCPPSTTVTLTAVGTDLECAEAFDWEFGDGATAETSGPTTQHTYPRLDRFNAAVTIVRPEECGNPRTQRRTVTVDPCPPSCLCLFLAIASALLLLAFLSLMPMIACADDPATKQALLIIMTLTLFGSCTYNGGTHGVTLGARIQ